MQGYLSSLEVEWTAATIREARDDRNTPLDPLEADSPPLPASLEPQTRQLETDLGYEVE